MKTKTVAVRHDRIKITAAAVGIGASIALLWAATPTFQVDAIFVANTDWINQHDPSTTRCSGPSLRRSPR